MKTKRKRTRLNVFVCSSKRITTKKEAAKGANFERLKTINSLSRNKLTRKYNENF